ncbi:MAG: single-stranded DNA-binding protein [Limisphaerales bacterium]
MSDINNISLTCRLTANPVINHSPSGVCWGLFSLASNCRYKDKTGKLQTETAFVPCKVFCGWAESLGQHKKGDQAVVTGRLRTERWEKDGESRSQLALICDILFFIAPKGTVPTPPRRCPKQWSKRCRFDQMDGSIRRRCSGNSVAGILRQTQLHEFILFRRRHTLGAAGML